MVIFLEYAYYVLLTYFYIMIVYVLLSWTPLRNSRFYDILSKIVNPYLGIFRGWLVFSNIDFTPMLGLILYQVILGVIARAI
ncbi:MAG TPA: YggT family protein [Bacillota bacterium]|nr:YggT family protein [Bacillota bacterium]